ncbi:uncharacterized protein K489DRAFT_384295 [Dissoconium aciculare CBS 342.82]|uniref:Uncharacterized protein n=1 Tax=Dissoconium aciculare CBS 342.82 TaxID=1314786 RepID=A0A6J3LSQ8_9PEZI|nr:uncharacterized protein K489DRAFT_384295 [Dissoconium aciculare CBS 342.82]KAF1818811.1 hypothetical protein K489DRAFT_384295 [Dissoconium aciculare CBS 342.82]
MLGRRIKKKGQASASQQNESQKTAEQLNQERAERNAKAEAAAFARAAKNREAIEPKKDDTKAK